VSKHFSLSHKHHVYSTLIALILDKIADTQCYLPQQCIFLRLTMEVIIWEYSKLWSKKQCFFFFSFIRCSCVFVWNSHRC